MDLSGEQTDAVRQWIRSGAGISEVQKRLASDFGISMTYMDVRFLIDDLGEDLKEPASPQPEKALAENSEPEENPGALPDSENVAGEVKVSVSPIQRPDCLAFGDVVFSDGSKAEWFLDRAGQLGLKQEDKSKPIPEGDIPVFQQKLQEEIRKLFG